MTNRPALAGGALFLLFFHAAPACAAQIPFFGKFAIVFGSMLLERLFEVTITMFLLRNYHLSIYRLASAYLAVSIALSIVLLPVILPAFGGNLVLGKLCVMLLETATLFMLINLDWFRRDYSINLLIRTILLAVIIGNLAAILFSLSVAAPILTGSL